MKIVSFFAGAGGLDLGFSKAGFNVIWANEFDKDIWSTYRLNHPETILDTRSITEIQAEEVPDCDGIIGGPPCQSWSEAGALKGIEDKRGQLFFDFIRILAAKQPKFFVAENVSGMLFKRHDDALNNIKEMFKNAGIGYDLSFAMLNAVDFGVPQDRKRVFFVGIRRDIGISFEFPEPLPNTFNLKDAIEDLKDTAVPALTLQNTNKDGCIVPNHEYMTGGFSSMYMSRNRVRSWDEPSFTIQASGRHAPLHPQAPKMISIGIDKREFVKGKEKLYRRLSVRECARIQTFPDDFIFDYHKVNTGYKMIGNAVPVQLAYNLAKSIKNQIDTNQGSKSSMNILNMLINLSKNNNLKVNTLYKGSNRINNVGDGLEEYLKEAIAGTFELDASEKLERFDEVFSYQGTSARPPDLMLRNGDAIEIKKTESIDSDLQLNSSHPKSKLYANSPFVNKVCRKCEDWTERDIIYAIGHVDKDEKNLKSLWCVYGSLYAADEEVYLEIKDQVNKTLSTNPLLEFSETKELGRLNRVDPLKITNMRIRGMWLIQPPVKVFDYIYKYDDNLNFQVFLLVPEAKYLSFDVDSLTEIERLTREGIIQNTQVKVKNPNNPVNLIPARLLILNVT